MVSMPVELSAVQLDLSAELMPYERLLTDAMRGDPLLFVRQDAVEAAWARAFSTSSFPSAVTCSSTSESRGLFLEITTGLVSIESDRMKLAAEVR